MSRLRRRKPFAPTREHIERAKRRILGRLSRRNGAVIMGSPTDVGPLHRYITRQTDLGPGYREQCRTLTTAVTELQSEGKIRWDEEQHMLVITHRVAHAKVHNSSQRYTQRRRVHHAA